MSTDTYWLVAGVVVTITLALGALMTILWRMGSEPDEHEDNSVG